MNQKQRSSAEATAVVGSAPGAVPTDKQGRRFRSLRLSVTASCNFACAYCNPEREHFGARAREPAFYLEIVRRVHRVSPLRCVHLTGGEPLLYAQLTPLIEELRVLGIPRVSLTTNAVRLVSRADTLRTAGLTDCNVSLDALSRRRFVDLTGQDRRDAVLAGIEACRAIGLPVKVNCTVMRGRNEREILPLFEYLSARGVPVRFLELMRMGPLRARHAEYYVSADEILSRIRRRHPLRPISRQPGATARYWQTVDGRVVGVITNHSDSFCADCDRLRVSHDGKLFGCLSSQTHRTGLSSDMETRETLMRALSDKVGAFTGSGTSMQEIGG